MSWRGWQSPSGDHGDTPAYPEQRSADWSMSQTEPCDWSLPGAGGLAESSGHCQPFEVKVVLLSSPSPNPAQPQPSQTQVPISSKGAGADTKIL